MINYVLAPSILAADFKVLGQEMKKTEDNGAEYIHFDVMDGMFVPSISFGMPVMASIHDATEQFMDAHLMVQEPIRYVEAFQKAGADSVTVHVEACEDVKATLNKIRECGMKVGLSINPETDGYDSGDVCSSWIRRTEIHSRVIGQDSCDSCDVK